MMSNENIVHAGDQQKPTQARVLGWSFMGLDGASVNSLKQVGRVLFAGTLDGIFRKDVTSDADWTRLGLEGIRVSDIYIDPVTSDTMYCAIDIRNLPDVPAPVTVYKTTDGGTTWHAADGGLPTKRVITIEGRSDNPQVLYCNVVDSPNTFLYRSENGGSSWIPIFDSTDVLTAVAISQSDPGVLYANVAHRTIGFSVLRSEDDGQTWGTILEGPFGFEGSISRALAIDPTDPDVVYVGVNLYIYITHDGGEIFNEQRIIFNEGTGGAINTMYIDPNHPTMVYCGGVRDSSPIVFQSMDAGNAWMEIPSPDERMTVFSMILDSDDERTIFVGTSRGVFKIDLSILNSVEADISLQYE
ncbi:hypothetical protein IIC65_07180 [Candidatus Sumerlaeota bacterium]|nr:hypothetical protein [Candidatus Sumerlaeota bacterium]